MSNAGRPRVKGPPPREAARCVLPSRDGDEGDCLRQVRLAGCPRAQGDRQARGWGRRGAGAGLRRVPHPADWHFMRGLPYLARVVAGPSRVVCGWAGLPGPFDAEVAPPRTNAQITPLLSADIGLSSIAQRKLQRVIRERGSLPASPPTLRACSGDELVPPYGTGSPVMGATGSSWASRMRRAGQATRVGRRLPFLPAMIKDRCKINCGR
jgi:hypothetical protein